MPKISIIIPTYNRAKFIKETIGSVLTQTVEDLEIIVVDDGSIDETQKIIEKLIIKDNRIKYFYQNNCGKPSIPRNLGFKNSTGEYIAFLDSDDVWFPKKLEKQIELFEKDKSGKLGFVDCGYVIIDENGSEIKQNYSFHVYRGEVFREFLKDHTIVTPGSILIKRNVLNKVGIFDERFKCMDDWDMWLRISKYYNFDFTDEKLFKYRVHKNSITVRVSHIEKMQDVIYIFEKNKKDYYLYHPQKFKESGVFHCCVGDMITGRKFLKEAIKLTPKDYKIYFHYILSLFGKNFYKFSFLIISPVFKARNRILKDKFNVKYPYNFRQKIFMDILNIEI